MLNRWKARMAERSGGLGHIVTPADRLARIAHDPQHVCQWQLARCGCFLPHLLICTAGRALGAARAQPFSTVSIHGAIARLTENRGLMFGIRPNMYHNTVRIATLSAGAVPICYREVAHLQNAWLPSRQL